MPDFFEVREDGDLICICWSFPEAWKKARYLEYMNGSRVIVQKIRDGKPLGEPLDFPSSEKVEPPAPAGRVLDLGD